MSYLYFCWRRDTFSDLQLLVLLSGTMFLAGALLEVRESLLSTLGGPGAAGVQLPLPRSKFHMVVRSSAQALPGYKRLRAWVRAGQHHAATGWDLACQPYWAVGRDLHGVCKRLCLFCNQHCTQTIAEAFALSLHM